VLPVDSERIKGGLKKATGTIKDKVGQMTGDRDLEAEGQTDQASGNLKQAGEKVKDVFK
jgi:uncharacterized protein YjbJ (UPF0337 family)